MESGSKVVATRQAGPEHQVVTVVSRQKPGQASSYRRRPCAKCPWRRDSVGGFPAEAFRHSASTAYDMAQNTFACHDSGTKRPATCAGFLLRGSAHNLAVRLAYIQGKIGDDVDDGGHPLFEGYREMAIANGVSPDDPVLARCRD